MAKRQRPRGSGSLYQDRPGAPWIARWFSADGRRMERSTRTTDRAAAERILAKRVADAAIRRDGVIDVRDDRYAAENRRPIAEHVSDWSAYLTAKGAAPKSVRLIVRRATAILGRMKAERLSDLQPSAIQAALAELRHAGRSAQTLIHYTRAVKQFGRWCRRDGRTREDALAPLPVGTAAADRRHVRRALDADELRILIDATTTAAMRFGLSGPERAMLYRVAVGTGFRANELRSLKPGCFRLDDDPPCVVLRAASSKHRREDVQPIAADLAEALRGWLADRPTDAPAFNVPEKTAAMMRADLRYALARWIRSTPDPRLRRVRRDSGTLRPPDAAGRVADFHALRVSFITALVRGGASVKVAQQLARHSTPTLTLGVYCKLGISDLSGALDTLPRFTPEAPNAERLRATGTYDDRADAPANDPPLKPRQFSRFSGQSGAAPRDERGAIGGAGNARKPLSHTAQRDTMRRGSTSCATVAQLVEQRFCKPQVNGSSPFGGCQQVMSSARSRSQ